MKVFITGATGFVGREVVRRVRAAGHSVSILARDPASRTALRLESEFGAHIRIGNILDEDSLSEAMAGADAAIHLVGIIAEVGEQTFERIHVAGTANTVAAARQRGVTRFVHMSALGTRPDSVSRYHQSKWAAEEAVRNSGLAFTIFRPSLIYGAEDRFVNLFARMMRVSPVVPVMGSARALFQPVSVQKVAACFSQALDESKSIGQTYDLCGSERLTFDELLDTIGEVTGRNRWKLHVPLGVAHAQARLLEWVFPRFLHRAPPLNRDQLIMLQEGNVGNPAPADELFSVPQESFRAGIARYLVRTAAASK